MTRQIDLSIRAIAKTFTAPLILSSVLLAPTSALPQQLPTGGNVTHGTATIAPPQGGTLNINQSSGRAIIDWNSFSVGAGGRVNFNQPGSSAATLNRVTGSTPSSIAGAITAPGTVLLVNPNGIAITPTGTVNVGSFAASTLDIKNSDFMAGNYKFTGNGSSAGVTNAGRINVSDGGFAALLGGRVANDGLITARLGRVGLGAGERITLDLSGDGFLQVEVPSNQLGNITDGSGQPLVSNRGKIRADGGLVHLSAATASNILRDAVNVPGSIRANSVGTRGGRIVLGGGAGGRVNVSGRISASSTRVTRRNPAPGTGGQIDITGAEIALVGAQLNASGATGGGRIRIGGDYQGSGDLPHAQRVAIDSASAIRADATTNGNGGTVIVWSDGVTSVSGTFSARGGLNGGDGGLVETSGHVLEFIGARVDTSAPRGTTGQWLLDPESLDVDATAAATISANLANSNVTLLTTATTATGPGIHWNGIGDISIQAPIYWTSGNTLFLNSYANIYINATIIGGAGSTLWLTTAPTGSVYQTAPIGVTSLVLPQNFNSVVLTNTGNIVGNVRTDDTGTQTNPGSISFTNNGNLTAGLLIGRDIVLNVGGSLTVTGGFNTLAANGSVISLVASGDVIFQSGSAVAGAGLNVVAGGSVTLQGITTSGALSIWANGNIQFDRFVVAQSGRSITSTTIRSDNGLVTFAAGRTIETSNAVEIFYNPYTATGSYANVSSYTGLTSGVGNGAVTAYMLVNNFNQLNNVRQNLSGTYALGYDIDASSTNCSCLGFRTIGTFSGTFDGRGHVIINMGQDRNGAYGENGSVGMFAVNNGTIRNIGMLGGRFNGGTNSVAGALVGENSGTITNSFSTATVIANGSGTFNRAGGLVGWNRPSGNINGGSYATGSVSGRYAGGLVGQNEGSITHSYAAGSVSGTWAGGLVGRNYGDGYIRYTYSLSSVNGTQFTGGLVGENVYLDVGTFGQISDSWAAGPLSGAMIGGLVGDNGFHFLDTMEAFNSQHSQSARVYYSYWDAATTGTSRAFGRSYHDLPGWSSEQVQYVGALADAYSMSSYSYFNDPVYLSPGYYDASFHTNWYMVEGATRPFLRAEFSTNIQNLHQLQLINMNSTATYRLARNIDASTELSSGMWRNNAFSAIAPIAYTVNQTNTFTRRDFGNPQNPPMVQTVWNGNVLTEYITYWALFQTDFVQTGRFYWASATGDAFRGTLDGNGHTISNLYVGGDKSAGLIYEIGSGGRVEDLGIVNSRFVATYGYSGSIAAINNGTIERSYAIRGAGTFNNVESDGIAGGLVGYNGGLISQSYASLYVWGVGQTNTANNDYGFYAIVGGLVGQNGGTIENAYATGLVRGNNVIGGLVGSNTGTIRNTYALTELDRAYDGYGLNAAGWLVGTNGGWVVNSYYLGGRSLYMGVDRGPPNSIGTALSLSQMQNFDTFASIWQGFDFRNVWIPPNQSGQAGSATAHYPEFYWANHTAVVDAADVTRVYGDANPQLLYSVYGLRSYDTPSAVPISVSTSADASSNVGSHALTSGITIRPPTAVGCAVPCGFASHSFMGLRINNNVEILLSRNSTAQDILNRFNAETYRTGVTASLDVNGRLVLTSANAFSLVPEGVTVGDAVAWLGLNPFVSYGPTQLQAVSTDGAAYRVITLPGTLSITPRPITVTADNQSRVYGDAASQLTYQITSGNLVNSDQLSGALTRVGGNNVGTYAINQGTLSASSNYALTYRQGTLNITPATLYYNADMTHRDYGDANPTFTGSVTGFVNNDTFGSVLTGTLGFTNTATATSNVGQYAITGSGLTANSNYVLQQAAGNATALIIDRRRVTVTADDQSREYGLANPTLTFTWSSLGAGLPIAGSLATTATTSSDVTANGYAITQGTVTNATNGNYNITFVAGTLHVTQADLTFTADLVTRPYGDANPTLTGQVTGFRNGQSVVTFGGDVWSTTATAISDVNGTGYAITGGFNQPSPNYRIVQGGGNATALRINRRDVFVTADNQSREYGLANPTLTFTWTSLGAGIPIAGSLETSGTETSDVIATGYAITQGTVTNATNANYNITYRPGTLYVTQADLTFTADLVTRLYGDANPILTGQVTGFRNGQTVATFGGDVWSTLATPTSVVGSYAITGGLNQPSPNYRIVQATGNATALTVDRRPVTVTADNQSREYGLANPPLTFQNSSLGAGIPIAGDLATIANLTSNVGQYAITQGAVTNTTNTNYAITYVPATLTINPATLVFLADAATRTYGAVNPLFGGQVTGFRNGETAVTFGGSLWSSVAIPTSNVGSYGIIGRFANASPNYIITQAAANATALTINPAHVVVTATGGNSVYGQSPLNPGFTATGLQNGEGFSTLTGLANSFGIGGTTNAGVYTLAVVGGLTNPNYVIDSRVTGQWNVARAPITVTADSQSRLLSEPDPTLTYRITQGQLFNGDQFSGGLSRDGGIAPPPGFYAITQGSLATSQNYTLSFNGATFEVRALPSDFPSQFIANTPTAQGNTTTVSFQPPPTQPVTFGVTGGGTGGTFRTSSTTAPTQVATTTTTDPVVTGTLDPNRAATDRALTYLPISQYDAQQYSLRTLPGYEGDAGEATVLTMIARAIAGEQGSSSLFVDNFFNANASATEFDLISQRVRFVDNQGNRVDPATGQPLPLTNIDPAGLLRNGPVMLAMPGPNNTQVWMLALRLTHDGRGIVANDPATGLQVVLAYNAETHTVGAVTGVVNMRTNTVIAITDTDALRAAGLDQIAPERMAALQTFAPTGFFAVGVN